MVMPTFLDTMNEDQWNEDFDVCRPCNDKSEYGFGSCVCCRVDVIPQGPDLDEASATSDEESMEIDEMSDSSDEFRSVDSRSSVYSVLVLCLLFSIFLCHPVLLCCSLVFSSLLFSLLFSSDKERRGTSDKERRGTSDKERRGTLGNVLKTVAVCIPEPVMKAMKLKKPTGKKHKGKSKHRVGDVKVNKKLPHAKKAKELLEKVKKHI